MSYWITHFGVYHLSPTFEIEILHFGLDEESRRTLVLAMASSIGVDAGTSCPDLLEADTNI